METLKRQAIDPVCGMTVDTDLARSSSYQQQIYYFCCQSCQRRFDEDPEGVLDRAAQREAAANENSPSGCCGCSRGQCRRWCPSRRMHRRLILAPCIRRSNRSVPGDCPICGMDLEPKFVDPWMADSRSSTVT